jgi:hypothetical protein
MLAAFWLIGSHVDEDGVLREPFALLPIGLMLLALGIVGAIASKAIRRRW